LQQPVNPGANATSVPGGATDLKRPADGKNNQPSHEVLAQAAAVVDAPPKELTGKSETPKPCVVFLVDQSYSMRGEKSDMAREQLERLLKGLPSDARFYILFFHSSGYDAMPGSDPLPATPENIQSMLDWSSTVRHVFGSKPQAAAMRALELHPGTVWLISDGKFPGSANALITESNKTVGARVNTVGVASSGGQTRLRELSEKNGGEYRFVPSK
jgi:hypothetical protein